jgi:hypothetical protein
MAAKWLDIYRRAAADAVSGGAAAPSTQAIDPQFAAALARKDPAALAFQAAGAPGISADFAARAGDADTQAFVKANGGGQANPAVAQLMAGYQAFLANQRKTATQKGRAGALAAAAGDQDPLLAQGGTLVGSASGGDVGAGGLPAGVAINQTAGSALQGHAATRIQLGGQAFDVFYDDRGRRTVVPA